jgi:hypothetical protein
MRRARLSHSLTAVTFLVATKAFADESIRMPTWSEPPAQGQAPPVQSASTPANGSATPTPNAKDSKEAGENFGALTSASSGIFGYTHARAAIFGYSATGTSVERDGDYSALGASAEYHTGGFSGKDASKVYFGYELRGAIGYQQGPEYKTKVANESEPEGSITALGEIGPTLVPFHWGGSVAGRVVLAPAIGLNLNGARYYESYVYLALSGRVQVFPSDTVMVSAQYGYVPWTAKQAYSVREHHLEVAVHVSDYGFGFRYQRDQISNPAGTKDAESPTIGGFVALLF